MRYIRDQGFGLSEKFSMAEYIYLYGSLVLLGSWTICLVVFPLQRKLATISALLSMPLACASVLFVPEYWQPVRLLNGITGIEDLIFSFATGGLAWVASMWLLPRRVVVNLIWRRHLTRYFYTVSLGVVVWVTLWLLGFSVMTAALVDCAGFTLLNLIRRPELVPLAISGALGFATPYMAFAVIGGILFPGFYEQWNHANLWGVYFLEVPLEEGVWALAFGALWPVFLTCVLEVRVEAPTGQGVPIGG
jgi:Lycopene cyclase